MKEYCTLIVEIWKRIQIDKSTHCLTRTGSRCQIFLIVTQCVLTRCATYTHVHHVTCVCIQYQRRGAQGSPGVPSAGSSGSRPEAPPSPTALRGALIPKRAGVASNARGWVPRSHRSRATRFSVAPGAAVENSLPIRQHGHRSRRWSLPLGAGTGLEAASSGSL